MDKTRQSNLELLRIVAMILIVIFHFAIHGGFDYKTVGITIPRLWYNFILMGGKVGVDIFVLISGYFLINEKDLLFKFKRLLKVWGQVFFYSMVFYVVFRLLGIYEFDITIIKETLFPITYQRWWFASTYFVLYIIHPFLNKFLNTIDKKTYQSLLVILVFIWSIIPTLFKMDFEGNSLTWFVTLYAIAGYIRLYGFNKNIKLKYYLIVLIVSLLITYLTSFIYTMLSINSIKYYDDIIFFYGQEKLTTLVISLSLFMLFLNLHINYHKWINALASTTFGVYLIHDYSPFRKILWSMIFKNSSYQNSLYLIPYTIIVVLVVYAVCTLIDLIRIKLIEKPYMKIIDKVADSLVKPFLKFSSFIKGKLFD